MAEHLSTAESSAGLSGKITVAAVTGLAALAVAVPVWGSILLVLRATEVAVFIVAFAGLHILSGRLGLISVGHGAFIGIGAVVAAHSIDDLSLPYLLAPLAGVVGAAIFGLAVGVPSLRLPGAYLALLTLAMAMVLPIGIRRVDGPVGYRIDGDIRPPQWTGLSLADSHIWQYILVVGVGLAIIGGLHLALRGRFTRALIAVRDEPMAAAAFGINVSRVHLTGVALSAGLAGAAGGLGLYATPLVAGSHFPFSLSVAMFALTLALGATRMWTIVPAALLLVLIPETLIRLGRPEWEPIVYAAVLLLMTRVSRGRGLVWLLERAGMGRQAAVPEEAPTATDDPIIDSTDQTNPWLLTPEPDPID